MVAGSAQAAEPVVGTGPVVVVSPCGRVRVRLRLDSGVPTYAIAVDGVEVLPAAPLGLTLDDADFTSRLTATDRGRSRTVAVDYELLQGEVSRVRKTMIERVISLRNARGLRMEIVSRADSEGAVALRNGGRTSPGASRRWARARV